MASDTVRSTDFEMYGMMYGMRKTTVYLPDDLKAALERLAKSEQRSEADIIREALRSAVSDRDSPSPRIPLTSVGLGNSTIAERTDELLEGFGSL